MPFNKLQGKLLLVVSGLLFALPLCAAPLRCPFALPCLALPNDVSSCKAFLPAALACKTGFRRSSLSPSLPLPLLRSALCAGL